MVDPPVPTLRHILERATFSQVVAATAALHVLAIAVLMTVEPAAHYNDALVRRRAERLRDAARRSNPEPRRPIDWAFRYSVGNLDVKSTDPLSAAQRRRLLELEARVRGVFLAVHGLSAREVVPLEMRFVPVSILNDPTYFQVDEADGDGIYYGRYFVGPRLVYLTDVAWVRNSHIVHELAHHLSHRYDLGLAGAQEESRARKLEEEVARLERRLASPDVEEDAGLPEPSAPWRHQVELVDGSTLRSTALLTPERRAWLVESWMIARDVFPGALAVAGLGPTMSTDAAAPSSPPPPVTDALLPATLQVEPWRVVNAGDRPPAHGRYDRHTATLHLTPRVFYEPGLLPHLAAHHWAYQHGLDLDPQTEETLAIRVEHAVQRARRGEITAEPATADAL